MRLRKRLIQARNRQLNKVAFKSFKDLVDAFNQAANDYRQLYDFTSTPVGHEDLEMLEVELKNFANIMKREYHVKDISKYVHVADLETIDFDEDLI
jgi:hypothetical protein